MKCFESLPVPQRNPELKCLAEIPALETQSFVHFLFYSAGLYSCGVLEELHKTFQKRFINVFMFEFLHKFFVFVFLEIIS